MHALSLPETFDRKAVSTFARTLLDHRGADMILDASGVHRMGTLAVEMLISARKQWQADGWAMSVSNASDPFLTAIHAAGTSVEILQTGGTA